MSYHSSSVKHNNNRLRRYAEGGFFQSKPCVTLRLETEWTELLDGGHNRLAKPMMNQISQKVKKHWMLL